MSLFFRLRPEVAGGLGSRTVMDRTGAVPIVKHLHYEFDGWLGDDIVESFPIYLMTLSMTDVLVREGLTGFLLKDVEVTKSDEFLELYPGRDLPEFRWLDVHGKALVDDFGLEAPARLIVSEHALTCLRHGHLEYCEISPA
jgi:hypothetical protein